MTADLLGGALRFYGLSVQSLWADELASWDFSEQGTLSQVFQGVRSDVHPPLYFLILHFTQRKPKGASEPTPSRRISTA